eukprot:3591045-Rhodomonas_salina.1
MSWGLAHRAAEKAFLARGLNAVSPTTGKYSPQFQQLRARFEHCNTARLSLARAALAALVAYPLARLTTAPTPTAPKPSK